MVRDVSVALYVSGTELPASKPARLSASAATASQVAPESARRVITETIALRVARTRAGYSFHECVSTSIPMRLRR